MDETQKAVLRKNHSLLVNTLDLSGTNVLDKLQQEDVISADEQDDILARGVKKDQNARLLFLLKRLNASKNPFKAFVEILDVNYGFVAKELRRSFGELSKNHREVGEKCFYCTMVENLIPNYVSHHLYEEGIISDDDLEEINNSNLPRKPRVTKLLTLLNVFPDKHSVTEQLRKSLQPKYTYILNRIDTICFQCQCAREQRPPVHNPCNQFADFEQRTEVVDNGYTRPVGDICREQCTCTLHRQPRRCDKNSVVTEVKLYRRRIQTCVAKDTIENGFRLPHEGALNKQIVKTNDVSRTPCLDSASRRVNGMLNDSSLPSFRNRNTQNGHDHFEEGHTLSLNERTKETHKCEELNKGIWNSESDIVRYTPSLSKVISKTLPNERRLMIMCTKLWERLFHLREEGNWETFYIFSRKAMKKFAMNPDILVSLYQIEMVVSTFYKHDEVNAFEHYEKAMDILPKTSMPTWHLGRFLPLKMMLLSKDKKYEEATSLSEEAQQAVSTLGPCLSTACVNFFEALYLENILRCTRNDTKSALNLAQRVKRCFLTAIDHFQREEFFPMQSFLNQVYLFLALFSLGVDYKYSSYVSSVRINESDVDIAEYYLNRFENGCWDKSTNWSRMLFFIARGEQHKQRNNLCRSLDYFNEAHSCAETGGYTDQISFINRNLELIGERQKQKTRIESVSEQDVDGILQGMVDSTDE